MKESKFSYERYSRQLILKEFGEAGQQKLFDAKVLVIGAGGLGCPALQYLAAAGIGTIGIADDDIVALNNLHRQVLYTVNDIGFPKAERAASALQASNPDIRINVFNGRINVSNALDVMKEYDFVIDGTDNFSSRYMINDACFLLKKPLIYGAVSRFEGQVAVFNYKNDKGIVSTNYRDLFPEPPAPGEVADCAEAGVLGVLPGIIGTMQAAETIKLITGIGQPLINRLLTYNTLNNQVFELELVPNKETAARMPADEVSFLQTNYDWLCGITPNAFEINQDAFNKLLKNPNTVVIDVREAGELPVIDAFTHRLIPLGEIKQNISAIQEDTIVLFCNSGSRSRQAAELMQHRFGKNKTIFSLAGGILRWRQQAIL